jgi:hypothetical protein
VFHLIVMCPECTQTKETADKMLTLLTGALTAITGFYFGRAVETGQKNAQTSEERQVPPDPDPNPDGGQNQQQAQLGNQAAR